MKGTYEFGAYRLNTVERSPAGCGKMPFFGEIRNLHYAELKADCS
jgi:hypothetical protein